jgi:hypothetical protein
MRLEKRKLGELEFVLDDNDIAEDHQFYSIISEYRIIQQGAGIFFYAKRNNELVSFFNTFDNTQLICSPNGYALAALFGAKRFLIGDERLTLDHEPAQNAGAIYFSRDLAFPLNTSKDPMTSPYYAATLEGLLEIFDINQINTQLDDLFIRCNDFTPGKKEEYSKGGSNADKYCRFNLESHQPLSNLVTDQIILINPQNKIVGSISFVMWVNRTGAVDVYLYDEIVDYFTLLNETEKAELAALYPAGDTALIAAKIEPKRIELMAPLFAAARREIKEKITQLNGVQAHVSAFIRAAAGRVESYTALNCTINLDIKVIHGPATKYAAMLDAHIKDWAYKKLQQASLTQFVKSNYSGIAKQLEITFAYRLFDKGNNPAVATTAMDSQRVMRSPK